MGQTRSQTERRPSGDRRLGEAHDCGCGRELTRLHRRRATRTSGAHLRADDGELTRLHRRRATRTSGAHLRADDDQRRFPGVSDAARVRVYRLTPRPRRPRAGPGGPAQTWRSAPQHIIAVNCTGVTPKKTRTAAAAAKSAPAPEIPPLNSPQLYINRELSLLAFQFRVLEEAQDERNPLLERVKFLSIVGSNTDEFFMVRVAGLIDQVDAGIVDVGPDGMHPTAQLVAIRSEERRVG